MIDICVFTFSPSALRRLCFLQECVCPQGGVYLSACWDTTPRVQTLPGQTPPEQTPPRSGTPWSRHPPRSRHPHEQTPFRSDTHPQKNFCFFCICIFFAFLHFFLLFPIFAFFAFFCISFYTPSPKIQYRRWPLLRTVRILLECILVSSNLSNLVKLFQEQP